MWGKLTPRFFKMETREYLQNELKIAKQYLKLYEAELTLSKLVSNFARINILEDIVEMIEKEVEVIKLKLNYV